MKFLLESNGLPADTTISLDGKKIGFIERCIFKANIETSKIFCRIGRAIPELDKKYLTNILGQRRIEILKIFPEIITKQDKKNAELWGMDFDESYLQSKKVMIFSDGTIPGTKIFLYGKIIPGLRKFKIIMETGEPISVIIEQYILPNIKDRDLNYFRKEDFEKPTAVGKKGKENNRL